MVLAVIYVTNTSLYLGQGLPRISKLIHIRCHISFDDMCLYCGVWYVVEKVILRISYFNFPTEISLLAVSPSNVSAGPADPGSLVRSHGYRNFSFLSNFASLANLWHNESFALTGSQQGHFIILFLLTLTSCGCVEILSVLLSGRQYTMLCWIYNGSANVWNRVIKMWCCVSWHLAAE